MKIRLVGLLRQSNRFGQPTKIPHEICDIFFLTFDKILYDNVDDKYHIKRVEKRSG